MAIDVSGVGTQNGSEFTGQELEAANQLLQQSVGTDVNGAIQLFGILGVGINVISLVFFITGAIGLYKLSKKLGDSHPWLAFIPLIQLYTFIKVSGLSFGKGLLLLIGHSILGIIAYMLIAGLGVYITTVITSQINFIFIGGFISGFLGALVGIFIATFFLYKRIADRAGQSGKTAFLMMLFSWCMFWIVANRITGAATQSKTSSGMKEDSASNTEL